MIKSINILSKNSVRRIIPASKHVGVHLKVKHVNGYSYTVYRSFKGQYIVVNGIRKYIIRGDTY